MNVCVNCTYKYNINCVCYHAGLDNQTRKTNQQLWTSNQIRIIVATCVNTEQ